MNYQEALALTKKYGQEHLLRYYDELSSEEQISLLKEIEALDFSLLSILHSESASSGRGFFEPLGALTVQEISEKRIEYERAGLEVLNREKAAAVLLAGGMGTRLGFDKPKGMYNIGETHDLYIFECLINNLLDVVRVTGHYMYLLIMTSELNHEDTVRFFEEKEYFGYDPDYIRFFVQDTAPCVGYDGKILMEGKGRIAVSPNGNGGWFHSLVKAGLYPLLQEHGVEYLSVFGVDNVCQRINDPAFVGAMKLSGCDVCAKVVQKADPNERVGVLCLEDGRPSIVEYYEMTDDMIHLRDAGGNLLYNYGVILNYLFRLDRLTEIANNRLPLHIVEKKIPFIDDSGILQKPESPNGYKFEYLVLDMIHLLESCLPYEVIREKEFAPIKNRTGIDSVESARTLLKENGVSL